MKHLILVFTTLLLFAGCEKESSKENDSNSIFGMWYSTRSNSYIEFTTDYIMNHGSFNPTTGSLVRGKSKSFTLEGNKIVFPDALPWEYTISNGLLIFLSSGGPVDEYSKDPNFSWSDYGK